MTKFTKVVTRETSITSGGRNIIVELTPPGLITFRLKGTRRKYHAAIIVSFHNAVKAAAWAEVQRRKEERKARRNNKS